ncbi:PTS fructose IIA subunit, partial [Klebsiella pneumoniae]
GFIVGGPVGDFELLLCHGTVCVVGKIRDLILQLSKSSIYSTKPPDVLTFFKSMTHAETAPE